jgi:hypothetical protein
VKTVAHVTAVFLDGICVGLDNAGACMSDHLRNKQVREEVRDKNVIILGSERVKKISWQVLEKSSRVENFHNGSEHTV